MSKKGVFQCSRFQAIAKSVDGKAIVHLRCKQWDCAYCARQNARQWRAGISKSIERLASDKFAFVTLTLDSQYHDKSLAPAIRYQVSIEFIKRTWDKLMKRYKRAFGKFEYIRVIEQHKTGTAHIHLLMLVNVPDSVEKTRYNRRTHKHDTYWHSDLISKPAIELGYGKIHDAKNIESDEATNQIAMAVGYIVKYMTKHSDVFQAALASDRVRKIQTSRGIKKLNFDDGGEIEFELKPAIYLSEYVNEESLPTDLTVGKKVEFDDFGGELWQYPLQAQDDTQVPEDIITDGSASDYDDVM